MITDVNLIFEHSYKLVKKACERDASLNFDDLVMSAYFYNLEVTKDEKIDEILLTKIINYANKNDLNLSLYNGLSGLGASLLRLPNCQQVGSLISNVINSSQLITKDIISYDLFSGYVGILNFLTQVYKHYPNVTLKNTIITISNYLIEITNVNSMVKGSSLLLNTPITRKMSGIDSKIMLFGNAHGLSGILSVLSSVYSIVPMENIKEHIIEISTFILKYRNDKYLYPDYVTKSYTKVEYLNYSWCNGSLGISYALYRAAKAIGNNEVLKIAVNDLLSLLLSWRQMIGKKSLIFCHGLISVAYISFVLFCETGISKFKKICYSSMTYIVEHSNEREKYIFSDTLDEESNTQYKPGLLTGELGVSLLMSSILKNKIWENDWIFLLH